MYNPVITKVLWMLGAIVAKLSMLVLLLGLILFVYWAAKYLKKDDLKQLVTWLIILGILGLALTVGIGGFQKRGGPNGPNGYNNKNMMEYQE